MLEESVDVAGHSENRRPSDGDRILNAAGVIPKGIHEQIDELCGKD